MIAGAALDLIGITPVTLLFGAAGIKGLSRRRCWC